MKKVASLYLALLIAAPVCSAQDATIKFGPHARSPIETINRYQFSCAAGEHSKIEYRHTRGKSVELRKLEIYGRDYAANAGILEELKGRSIHEVYADCFDTEVLLHITTYDDNHAGDVTSRFKTLDVHVLKNGSVVIN